ncbi:c-type cytochrome [Leptolyngbya sp. NK1-12]|uniref:C-type cytochrome n=1 Tax=Leptolyngbya sp. NK1-12 TaxID=2547451 RepID=A0AA96WKG4_9CYAN|nr:c-type cytochrome [Leptolyngbya sp. NK1-12]
MRRFFSLTLPLALICAAGFGLDWSALALADQAPPGAQIFELHCAGCHIHGGNIVRRNKTLKLKALQRNGMDNLTAISEIVLNGKGNMSAYQDRLTEAEIQSVAAYVLEQAEQGWK